MLDVTPLLRLYARYRLHRLVTLDPVEGQRRTLKRLLRRAAETRFGRDYDFASIGDVETFQATVPLRRYEDFWRDYWEDSFPALRDVSWPGTIPYFAVTSGTTSGRSKYIPVTSDMLRSNAKAGVDLYCFHLRARPASRIMGGCSFMLGGSTRLVEEAPGVRSGDLSGISVAEMPWFVRPRYFPPTDLALIEDWEEKVEILAKRSLDGNIRMISGTPSWLLLYFERAMALQGGTRLVDLYPDLEMLVHGGVNFEPYRERFERLCEGSRAELREVYPASEGFIALADEGPDRGLRLCLDHGIFLEFVPVADLEAPQPRRHWIATVEPGVEYAVVVTTCAGLWAYLLGDTVRFVDEGRWHIEITGRTSQMLSAFGEHVIASEIDEAVSHAAAAAGASVTDYAAGAVFPEADKARGRHLLIVEFEQDRTPADLDRFAAAVDAALQADNDDYRAHRSKGFGLDLPIVAAASPGMFAAWMKSRGRLGGQNKVPRIVTDEALFRELRQFNEDFAA